LSKVFDHYAAYYDLLNSDKPYASEAAFVARLVRDVAPSAHTLLELGCGTGQHAIELAQLGFEVRGIDLSPRMVEAANARIGALLADRVSVDVADLRTLRLGRRFDSVASLFHVISYQTSNSDLAAAFATAAAHLRPGGALVFDFWYGPAVLAERPSVRVKRVENERVRAMRLAEPVLHAERNVVDVNFSIYISEPGGENSEVIHERHAMRYLFLPELEAMLDAAGFDVRRACEWMSDKPLDLSTWRATVAAVRR
jgi:SAM-dependent methyltransferase